MKKTQLKQGFMVVPIVLALWTVDASASGNASWTQVSERLFSLSIEQLMQIPIDLVGNDAELPETSLREVNGMDVLKNERGTGASSDTLGGSLTSTTSEGLDCGRYQDEK
jgi:hypothetical protein